MLLLYIMRIEAMTSQEGDLVDSSLNGFFRHRVESGQGVVAELHGVHAKSVALERLRGHLAQLVACHLGIVAVGKGGAPLERSCCLHGPAKRPVH